MTLLTRSLMIVLWLFLLVACTDAPTAEPTPAVQASIAQETPAQKQTDEPASSACPLTEPVWAKPPEDSAVQDPPAFGHYFVNPDRSIWASAWWAGQAEEYPLQASEEGLKVGWFRPAGAALEITGQRTDGQAPPLEAHVPCCYPTRFQATGLSFPTEGCWTVTARAAESEISFVVWVEPENTE
jgi:hypothetical protein